MIAVLLIVVIIAILLIVVIIAILLIVVITASSSPTPRTAACGAT